MKKYLFYFTILVCLSVNQISAQATFEYKAIEIAHNIENIVKEEKAGLKNAIDVINKQLEKGKISNEEAEAKKNEFAEKCAKQIENRVAEAKKELNDLVQLKVDGKIKEGQCSTTKIVNTFGHTTIMINDSVVTDKNKQKTEARLDRTISGGMFAFGFNNLATNGGVNNSDFNYWGSYFFELGPMFNTRLLKKNNLLHLEYGLTFVQNNLRPTDNRSFVVNGSQTSLEKYPLELTNSRFENGFLTIPLHLEFDFTKDKNKYGDFKRHQGFHFGIGGYGGLRLYSKQKIEYGIDGNEFKQKERGDFNVNDFIYGLNTYVGYKAISLYLKYDLNPLFYSNPVKQNNVSLGLRFGL